MTETPPISNDTAVTTPPVATTPPKKRFFWKLLFLLLLLGIASGASWLSYQLWLQLQQTQQHLHEKTADMDARIADLAKTIQQFKQQQKSQPDALPQLKQQITQVQQQHQELNRALQGVYQRLRQISDNETHSLNEISALLYIANQHLLLAHDVNAALSALKAADLRLREFQSPDLLAVRRQLREDIQQLQSIEQADVVGISLQLSTYSQQVREWPLLQGQQILASDVAATPKKAIDFNDWRNIGAAVWQQLRQLVVIRHNAQAERGLLSASQRALLSQTLQAKLEISRLQLQGYEQQNFRLELRSILALIQAYYDTNSNQIKVLQQDLSQLQDVVLAPQLPDISKTLAMLQQQQRQNQQDDLTTQTAVEPTAETLLSEPK